jgi:hypothetical protein
MKILVMEADQLNKILDGFGTAITDYLSFYKEYKFALLHQTSVNELINSTIPDLYKHCIGVLVQLMNMNGYSILQINK